MLVLIAVLFATYKVIRLSSGLSSPHSVAVEICDPEIEICDDL